MMPCVLSIAGFDPTSGAGVSADIKTAAAFKCYGLSVISAITIQNSMGVSDVKAVDPDLFKKQMEHLISDVSVDAVKIGMLVPAENIAIASRILSSRGMKKIVVDPIISSSSGFSFHGEEGLEAMKKYLLPIAEVVTPNIHEASVLTGVKVSDLETMKNAAKQILALGARNVVVKGGHLEGMATDLLYDGKRFYLFDAPKTRSADFHGLGCAFSMALACLLAKGEDIYNCVDMAKKYIRKLISYPVKIGKGRSVLDHIGK